LSPIKSWLIEHGRRPRARRAPNSRRRRFLERLRDGGAPFLVLTNNSMYTPRDLAARLRRNGLDVPEKAIWTSALATANLLLYQGRQQK
jgi:NagD protein